ncbi:tetratricopeptide repeat protein [Microvirga arsenatis]|uniref:Tetratricopeptide repeat protein n=1 Tax=Microvirga arsenatis TaxID=2692265 RepID=A0ABW9YW78_9HYPH|nr:tetratricopeptide repeat protein [Microvirga arsenatis]NBJ10562.1 tetratricopeptide repeat protein [Microvirga arsenatis]NBJ24539.1 tetratricopeptide repeat protein [Microvirga arsenatis]
MMRPSKRPLAACLVIGSLLLLTACSAGAGLSSFGDGLNAIELPASVETYPDREVLQVAKAQFAEGNYGHAVRYYERAVEVAPKNPEAWLGLAASYDRVRRFDLADRAYREAGLLIGDRAEYYNNVGYSYLLRGDAAKARANFLKAYEIDPTSVTVNNNLEMLRDNLSKSGKS